MGSRLEKNSTAVRKRLENHEFAGEDGEEYAPSAFGGFPDYFRRKKIKLQNVDAEIRASAGDRPPIFRGVVGHVIGYTQPSLSDLHKAIVEYGGVFLQYLDGKTMATHIICSALPPKKMVEFSRYRMVKPAWVVDSISAGKLLPWADYRVIDEGGARQKTIKIDGGKMMSQATQQTPLRYREQTQNSFYTDQLRSMGTSPFQGSSSPLVTPRANRPSVLPVESIEDPADDEMDDDTADLVEAAERAEREARQEPAKHSPTVLATTEEREEVPPPAAQKPQPDPPGPPKEGKTLTSEEHNALLLSDPRLRKSSTANPEFLKQYYSESRLHHLSTWKAELKSRMQRLAADRGPVAPKGIKRKPGARRYILHVDFDSFFCAVSLKKHPEHDVDKPAVVAHGTGTGSEIASCNYPARAFGVKNGMWMKRALELCPDLKVLGYDFPAYEEASALFYDAVLEVGGVVQSVSIDEALVDVTGIVLAAAGSEGVGVSEGSVWREQEKADEIALRLRERVREKTGCNVSVGIGGSILLAKVALRKAKPAGQYQIKPEEVLDILGDLKVEDLPGVAYSISGKLEEIGVKLVKDIRQTSKERLTSVLGPKTGEKLWEYSRGIDRTEVGEQPVRKSVSAEVNWGIRFINQQEAEDFVGNLCKELERRLLNEGVKGRHLTVKIMRRAADAPLDPPKHLGHGKCDTFNKSIVFGVATNNGELIGKEAVAVLRSFNFSPGDLRGLGVQLTKLEPLKASAPEGSQKRLNFGAFAAPPSAKKQKTEAIEDGTPEKPKPTSHNELDPIADDPLTPRKPKIHPALALARANEADASAMTPLNVTGTQFIMPPNPDPAVLAELPPDIRKHFVTKPLLTAPSRDPSPSLPNPSRDPSPSLPNPSRTHSPALLPDDIPSDIDPEVFHALPPEMQAEILASYGPSRPPRGQGQGQSILPQSPRKDRLLPPPRKAPTPTKRGAAAARGGGGKMHGLFSRSKAARQQDAGGGGLQQTNFLTAPGAGGRKRGAAGAAPGAAMEREMEGLEEIDPTFLAELPEDVRREVVADHRRRRMATRGGLLAPPAAAPGRQGGRRFGGGGQTKVRFPGAPEKVGLGGSGTRDVGEVKDMINAWHRETKGEGPHGEDVKVLERYVARVVGEERDMEKARKVVRWLEWVVEEDEGEEGRGKEGWRKAVEGVKASVQEAMRERGLGRMEFE
ncbi:DNA repair protein [Coniochaeta ligniaria NRRL 30616]|uniref:DNA repair protein REV1 n=1 Tax=Coniochaeta ligniaria NRRL 30616 TaxID=1408157 RepID=A0A1J7JY71_9PEZI|nr:DNA repair protein [Coniochaeta ligniaria NRRL 30616]